MPSHTCPVVAVPVKASTSCCSSAISVLTKGHAGGFVELPLPRGPERVGQHDEENADEIGEAPGLGELGKHAVGRAHRRSSADVGFVVVELEVRSEERRVGKGGGC